MNTKKILEEFKTLCDEGLNSTNAVKALNLIGITGYTEEDLKSFKLWCDYMPLSDEMAYTEEQRNLHIMWDSIDTVPLGINCEFAIPYRQIIAKKLFKKCGDGFISGERCRFNFGNLIEVGENVSWNSGVYIDAKGGVEFGDFSMLAEDVKIFSHTHDELNHMKRTYKKVTIMPYATLFVASTILPGVTIGTGSMVAGGAIVTRKVPKNWVAAGIPAILIRRRKIPKDGIENINHYFMKDKMFQNHKD